MKKDGFSLIELVVSTAVLAVLLALTATGLRGARRR
ncbi:MAG: type II secretion system protein, partial [Planctomycetota bacterium]